MKPLLYALIFLCGALLLPVSTQAQTVPDDPGNFITTWNTENSGSSADNQITIPGTGTDYDIYWENTASSTLTGTTTATNAYTITFPEPGIYEVQISGDFTRIRFNNSGDRDKILTVEQWGDSAWTSMDGAFFGASNLRIPASDAPDLSGVTNMNNMFRHAFALNDSLNHWDTSSVTEMQFTFRAATSFNGDISDWDTSNVTTMFFMFLSALEFNQDISGWDVSSVENFSSMLNGAIEFNQPIGNWNTASATDMSFMLKNARSFNQPLNNWDVSNVVSLRHTFSDATAFNQPLDQWDVSNVANMNNVFSYTEIVSEPTVFDQDISAWDIGSVTDMGGMFTNVGLSQTNQTATLESWAAQAASSTIENISLHIGVKTYTDPTAINTLESLGWTITEQYQAEYSPGPNATLIGSGIQKPINNGATTTEVEILPDDNCTFLDWSDGSTQNPRSDALTDNLSVVAELSCRSFSSGGTSPSGRAAALERQGNDAGAAAIRDRFGLDNTTTTSTPDRYTPPTTLEESIAEVKRVPETVDRIMASDPSPETLLTLIVILMSLVEVLMEMIMQDVV